MMKHAQAFVLTASLFSSFAHATTASFAIIGDAGKFNSNTKLARDSIARSGVKDLVLPGDNLYSGTYSQHWTPWSDFEFSVVAIGNHNDGFANEVKFFEMPGEYYVKTVQGVRFIVLNSENKKSYAQQASWFEKQLQDKTAPLPTYVVWHHPPYTVTSFHDWEERRDFQEAMRPLLKKYRERITALLVGHDHIGASYCLDTLPMIVSGAIWETRTPQKMSYWDKDGTRVEQRWIYPEDTIVWAKLDVDSESKESNLSFIRAEDDQVLWEGSLGNNADNSFCSLLAPKN